MATATQPSQTCQWEPTEVGAVGSILMNLPHEAESETAAIRRTLEITHQMIGAGVVSYFTRNPSDDADTSLECIVPEVSQPEIVESLGRFAQIAISERSTQAAKIHDHEFIVSIPVHCQNQQVDVLSAILQTDDTGLSPAIQSLQFVAAYIANWRGRPDQLVRDRRLAISEDLSQSIQDASTAPKLKRALTRFSETLRTLFHAEMVALATPNRIGRFSISVVVPNREFDAQSDLIRGLDAVVQEAKMRADDDPELLTLDLAELMTDAAEQLKMHTKLSNHYAVFLRNAESALTGICIVPLEHKLSPDCELAITMASSTLGALIPIYEKAQPRFPSSLERRRTGTLGAKSSWHAPRRKDTSTSWCRRPILASLCQQGRR